MFTAAFDMMAVIIAACVCKQCGVFVGGSEGRLTTSPPCVTASHSGSVDTSPSATAATTATAAACSVMSWSSSDVARWLHHNDLDSLVDRSLTNTAAYHHLVLFHAYAVCSVCSFFSFHGSHASWKIPESSEFLFLKFPGPGKSWKMNLVLESPDN